MPLFIAFNNKNYLVEDSYLQTSNNHIISHLQANSGSENIQFIRESYPYNKTLLDEKTQILIDYAIANSGNGYSAEIRGTSYNVDSLAQAYTQIENALAQFTNGEDTNRNTAVLGLAIVGLAIVGQGGL